MANAADAIESLDLLAGSGVIELSVDEFDGFVEATRSGDFPYFSVASGPEAFEKSIPRDGLGINYRSK
jgi:hypothetical protein